MNSKLIVNADDFGLTKGVNQAIIECYRNGSISNTTLMVNTEATEHAVELAKNHPNLGIGLHFNLTLGRPISASDEIPRLVDGKGNFYSRNNWRRKPSLGLNRSSYIETEFLAQIDQFYNYDLPITHIDGHDHIISYPSVFPIVSKYCVENNIPMRIPYTNYFFNLDILYAKNLKKLIKGYILNSLIKLNKLSAYGSRIIANDYFFCIFDFLPVPNTIQKKHYIRILNNLKNGVSELMVHPAHVDDKLKKLLEITDICKQEYRALMDFSMALECKKRDIRLIKYSDLR